MRYKRSCFNPTLAKHDLRRFWPLPVAIFVFFLVTMVLAYHNSMVSITSGNVAYAVAEVDGYALSEAEQFLVRCRNAVYNCGYLVVLIQLFTALACALFVMQHIHGRKQIQFYHGLPMTRRCIYTTNVVVGLLMGLVPLLLAELIMVFIALSMGVEVFPVFQLMGLSCASFLIYYAIAIIACVLAGQSFGAVLLYAGMNCVVLAISAGSAGIARYMLPGFNENILLEELTQWLTPVLWMLNKATPVYTDESYAIPYGYPASPYVQYAIAGILLLILGGFLYQIRRGETAGEMIAFPFIRGLCKVLVALMAGLGGTVIVVLALNPYEDVPVSIIMLLVLGLLVIGWIAADMVIRKTFRVFGKKYVVQCLTLAAAMLLVLVGARLDVTGYVNRTPDLSRVTEAYVQMYGVQVEVEPTDLLAFHELILDNQDELSNNTTYRDVNSITIGYHDEEYDYELHRQYYILGGLESNIMQEFMTLMSVPEYNYRGWFSWQNEEISKDMIKYAELNVASRGYYGDNDEVTESVPYFLKNGESITNAYLTLTDTADGYAIYQAICRDIQEGNMRNRFWQHFSSGDVTEYGNINFVMYAEPYDDSYGSYEVYRRKVSEYYCYIDIYETMTHTLDALEELGITLNPEALK